MNIYNKIPLPFKNIIFFFRQKISIERYGVSYSDKVKSFQLYFIPWHFVDSRERLRELKSTKTLTDKEKLTFFCPFRRIYIIQKKNYIQQNPIAHERICVTLEAFQPKVFTTVSSPEYQTKTKYSGAFETSCYLRIWIYTKARRLQHLLCERYSQSDKFINIEIRSHMFLYSF